MEIKISHLSQLTFWHEGFFVLGGVLCTGGCELQAFEGHSCPLPISGQKSTLLAVVTTKNVFRLSAHINILLDCLKEDLKFQRLKKMSSDVA